MSAPDDHIIVVGAGCSALVLDLVADGYSNITAVDISHAALDRLRASLGEDADAVDVVVSDVCTFESSRPACVWHDRATFHFLVDDADRSAYIERVVRTVVPGGHLVLAGFSPSGPEQCSGLDVARHSLDDLVAMFAPHFDLVEFEEREHRTPWDSAQQFLHTLFRRNES